MAKKTPKKPTDAQPTIPTPNAAPISTTAENNPEKIAAASSVAQAAKPRATTRRPEIVAAAARANLVPINLDDEIRRTAYLLSERRGFEPGHETEDWLSAERQVLTRYRQTSA